MIVSQYSGVLESFLRMNDYVKNYQTMQHRQLIFDNFLQYLLQAYGSYRPFFDLVKNLYPQERPSVFRSFRTVLETLIKQFMEISEFDMNEIRKLQNRRLEELRVPFENVVNKLQILDNQQKAYKTDLRKIAQRADQIRQLAIDTKQKRNDVVNYYSENYLYNKYEGLLSKEQEEVEKPDKACQQKIEQLLKLQSDFLTDAFNYRKALYNCRYFILNRFKATCSQVRSELSILFVALFENTRRGKAIFKRDLPNDWNYLRASHTNYDRNVSDFDRNNRNQQGRNTENSVATITKATEQYKKNLNDLNKLIGKFVQALSDVYITFRSVNEKYYRSFTQNCNTAFSPSQSPILWARPVFEAFEVCTNKFTQMGSHLKESQNDLTTLSQKLERHIQISISLLQSPNVNADNSGERARQIAYHTEELEKQINSSELQRILRHILDVIEGQLAEIVRWLENTAPKKKKKTLENSMDISTITEFQEVELKQEVTKDQQWLWADWKDYSYKRSNLDSVRAALEAIKAAPPPPENSADIETYQCTLANRRAKGTLALRDKEIKFTGNQLNIKVPYNEINNVTTKSGLLAEILTIETSKGQLVFQGINKVENCKTKIEQQRSGGGDRGAAAPVEKRPKIVLQAAQIVAIQSRKQNIKKDLMDKSKLNSLIPPVTYKDIDIDDFYSVLYSDEPKVIKGKRWDCASAYCLVQTGNRKLKASPYNTPGPKFYSLKDGVTFQNCPLYSERTLEYDHDLPKLPIPFMPKFVHCKQTQRIYWISHEEFQYYAENRSSGAPYASSLYVKLLHIVKKNGSNIEVQYYGGVQFVEEPSIKNMLKEKAQAEMRENLDKNIKLYHERVNALKEGVVDEPAPAGGGQAGAAEGDQGGSQDLKTTLENMKKKNTILLASLGVLLLSIFLKILIF